MATVQIPLTTLPAGVRDFGPANLADADTSVLLMIDRTPAGGLNATPAVRLTLDVMISLDGGASWTMAVNAVVPGGPITLPPPRGDGVTPIPQSGVGVSLSQFPGTGRRIKATLTTTGSSVAVAGTLTTS